MYHQFTETYQIVNNIKLILTPMRMTSSHVFTWPIIILPNIHWLVLLYISFYSMPFCIFIFMHFRYMPEFIHFSFQCDIISFQNLNLGKYLGFLFKIHKVIYKVSFYVWNESRILSMWHNFTFETIIISNGIVCVHLLHSANNHCFHWRIKHTRFAHNICDIQNIN